MQEKLPHVDLNYFYNNIKKIDVKPISEKNIVFINKKSGDYTSNTNVIRIREKIYLEVIDHELFHMASSFYDEKNKISYIGFHHQTKKGEIGRGINEGYTQLLTERYFLDQYYEILHTYKFEVNVVRCLEMIIGKQMENMYFKADLLGLITELEKYDDRKNIIKFINNVDFISYHLNDKKYVFNQEHLIKTSINEVFKFLLNCYLIKIKQDIENEMINENSITNMIYSFIDLINKSINVKNDKKEYNYEFINVEDIKNIVENFDNIYVSCNSNLKQK